MNKVFFFKSPQSMLDYIIRDGQEIYCLETREYVSRCSEERNEICVYWLRFSRANDLAAKVDKQNKHWKDFLETNRYICSGQEAIEYFENNYAKAWANADGIFCIQKI